MSPPLPARYLARSRSSSSGAIMSVLHGRFDNRRAGSAFGPSFRIDPSRRAPARRSRVMDSVALLVDRRQSETAIKVARGTRRLWRAIGCSTVTELVLLDGRRADIVAIGPDGSIHIVEIKSSLADLRS